MIPKLFSAGPINLVRSHLNEYKVINNVFEVKTYDDFYYFIKQGFLLADDPRTEKMKPVDFQYGNQDDDILKRAAGFKKKETSLVNPEEIKSRFYDEYYRMIQTQIENGTLEGYPSDMRAKADEYVKNKMAENFSTIEKTDKPEEEKGEAEEEVIEESTEETPEVDELTEPTPDTSEEEIPEKMVKPTKKNSRSKKGKAKVKEVTVESSIDVSADQK